MCRPKVQREKPALYDMKFVVLKTKASKEGVKAQIVKLGGKVVTKIDGTVLAVISNIDEVDKHGARVTEAQGEDVHVVSEDFVSVAAEHAGKIPELVKQLSIADWGSDVGSNFSFFSGNF